MAKRRTAIGLPNTTERPPAQIRVRSIDTEELRLVDRSGRPRATLELTRAGPRLAMMHEDGTIAIEITLAGDGCGIRLADQNGDTRVFAGITRGGARMGMADTNGSQRIFLGVNSSGTPTVTLYDSDQRQAWTALSATPSAPKRPKS